MKLRSLGFLLLLSLTSCGFSPLYGDHETVGTPVAAALQNVAIANIPDASGQQLRNLLIDRFYSRGRPTKPTAKLFVTLRETGEDLGIQKDATATRSQLELWAEYQMRDRAGAEMIKGTAHSVVSYNKLEAQYGNVATKRSARERAIKEVSEQIANRVALYFANATPPAP